MTAANNIKAAVEQGRTIYIVEHLDPEIEAWQLLEYNTIATESAKAGSQLFVTGVPEKLFQTLPSDKTFQVSRQGIEEMVSQKIIARDKVCLLDPKGEGELSPKDGDRFQVYLFGGILGDEPPRDRTAELRKLGFIGRRLGPEQMTTDTAARVTRIVVQDRIPLDQIPYVDRPSIETGPGESVEMPFKYVKDKDGLPVLPGGMLQLLAEDADKGIVDLL